MGIEPLSDSFRRTVKELGGENGAGGQVWLLVPSFGCGGGRGVGLAAWPVRGAP